MVVLLNKNARARSARAESLAVSDCPLSSRRGCTEGKAADLAPNAQSHTTTGIDVHLLRATPQHKPLLLALPASMTLRRVRHKDGSQ